MHRVIITTCHQTGLQNGAYMSIRRMLDQTGLQNGAYMSIRRMELQDKVIQEALNKAHMEEAKRLAKEEEEQQSRGPQHPEGSVSFTQMFKEADFDKDHIMSLLEFKQVALPEILSHYDETANKDELHPWCTEPLDESI